MSQKVSVRGNSHNSFLIKWFKSVILTFKSSSCFPTSPMSEPISLKLFTDSSLSLSTASSQSASERPKYFKDASLILFQKRE